MSLEIAEFACRHNVFLRGISALTVRREMFTGALKMVCLFDRN